MSYIDGDMIKELRERKHMTQAELAGILSVSPKTVSKWETKRGYPDIVILEDLARALDVSVPELLSGVLTVNRNRSADVRRSKICVYPVCGNVIWSVGEAVVSCCGNMLLPGECEEEEGEHVLTVETVEDEYLITSSHPMDKKHYISFVLIVYNDSVNFVKLYPESDISVRFGKRGAREILYYCVRDGLYRHRL